MLYIIVPVFNRVNNTITFLKSLYNQKYKEFKLVVVDDNSTDGTASFIKSNYPDVDIVEGSGSLYWGGSINAGLKFLRKKLKNCDIIAFANNDIVFENDTIVNIVDEVKMNKMALYHSITVDNQRRCVSTGSVLLSWPFFLTHHPFRGKELNEINDFKKVRIDFATARFLVFHSDLLALNTEIDANHFIHYSGDYDFTYTFKRFQVKTYIVPKSVCVLDTTPTSEKPGNIHGLRNFITSLSSIKSTNNLKVRYLLGAKHCPKYLFPLYLFSVFVKILLQNILSK